MAGQHCGEVTVIVTVSWLLVGDWEAWSQEGAFQLPAAVCFGNATALRVYNRLRDPLPSPG